VPTISPATLGIGEVRCGPSASGVPSSARIDARGASFVLRCSCSPGLRPGKVKAAMKWTRAPEPLPVNGTRRTARSVPNTVVGTRIRTAIELPFGLPTCVTVNDVAVAVSAAVA
jgi:hypothetical protein